jgi:LCP family protein required for cell wall assembly
MRATTIAFCISILIMVGVVLVCVNMMSTTTDNMLNGSIPERDNTTSYMKRDNNLDEYTHLKTHRSSSENYEVKDRTNLVFLGIEEGPRTDTIVFVSIDYKNKKALVIFIPRDTYYHEAGYDNGDQRKINAVYGRSGEQGSIEAVSKILCGVPIHHYVSLKYDGVEKIVDAIGGVQVDVAPGIEGIGEGKKVLDGKQSVVFLRHRRGYPDGDLGRIRAQQRFIISAVEKLKGSNTFTLLSLANTIYRNMDTDMSDADLISLAIKLKGMEICDISMHILPGTPRYEKVGGRYWSYFFPNVEQVEDIFPQIVSRHYLRE